MCQRAELIEALVLSFMRSSPRYRARRHVLADTPIPDSMTGVPRLPQGVVSTRFSSSAPTLFKFVEHNTYTMRLLSLLPLLAAAGTALAADVWTFEDGSVAVGGKKES